ncbi:ribonuclease H-like domain-containing protein [Hysterangium stoloniferum]|nr:ribonuclease H-like domain-containing protein [Hysterangium stoloniferum]
MIYMDGSWINPGTIDEATGAGVYVKNDPTQNKAIRVTGERKSNQVGELVAILEAIRITPKGNNLKIHSDPEYALKGILKHKDKWEDQGWIDVENAELFQKILYELNISTDIMKLYWVKGHSKNKGNDEADCLANKGALNEMKTKIDTEIPDYAKTKGKLCIMTQNLLENTNNVENE